MNSIAVSPNPSLDPLTYTVALEQKADNHWVAAALGWWNCEAEGVSRGEALNRLNQKLAERLHRVELLQQPLPQSLSQASPTIASGNPWLEVAGKYENDPQFDAVMAHIAAYRQELDAESGLDL